MLINNIHIRQNNWISRIILVLTTNWLENFKKGKSELFDSCDRPSNLTQIGCKSSTFCPYDDEFWWMTSKYVRAPLLHNDKLYASFQSHWWNQTGVTVRKWPIQVKISNILSHVTLKFDGWPSKIIGYLFYATSNYVHYFMAINQLKLGL